MHYVTVSRTMTVSLFPKLHFREPFEGITAFEVPHKGWYAGVTVELEDGRRVPVFFYDPVRLTQDLESDAARGEPYIAEHSMIVVPEVTEAAMQRSNALAWERASDLRRAAASSNPFFLSASHRRDLPEVMAAYFLT